MYRRRYIIDRGFELCGAPDSVQCVCTELYCGELLGLWKNSDTNTTPTSVKAARKFCRCMIPTVKATSVL